MGDANKNDVLRGFLAAPANSVTREAMYFNRLYFELKLAAARRSYALSIFEPEVDRDGFDIILDDHDSERRFQLKTVTENATTASWKIHKRLIRPAPNDGEAAGWVPMTWGLGGGLLVLVISLDDPSRPISYRYTDWFIMNAFAEGLIRKRSRNHIAFRKECYDFLCHLTNGLGSERITIPKRFLLKPIDVDNLLALAGFHSSVNVYQPFANFMDLFRLKARISQNGLMLENGDIQLAAKLEHAAVQLLSIVDEPRFVGFEIPDALKENRAI